MHFYEHLATFFKEHPFLVICNMAFTFLTPVQDILLPHFYGKLIDAITFKKGIGKFMVFVLCILTILEAGYIVSDYHDIFTFSSFQTFTRKIILGNVMNTSSDSFSELKVGEIMSKISKIPSTAVVWYERMKYHIIPFILVLIVSTVYFSAIDKTLGILIFVLAIAYLSIVIGVPQFACKNVSAEKDKAVNVIHEEVDDTLRNFIAIHGDTEKQAQEIVRIDKYERLFTKKFADTMSCLLKTDVYSSTVLILFLGTFMFRCYQLINLGKLPTSKFVSLFLIVLYICNAMMGLEHQLREIIFDWGIITEADSLLDQGFYKGIKGEMAQKQDINLDGGIGMKNVSFSFPGTAEPTLKDVTFHVNKGDTVLVLGDVGSGKSTILKLLLKLSKPTSGTIYFGGKSYSDIPTKQIREKIGYVPQQPILFNRTVLENIQYGNDNVTPEHIQRLIKDLGLEKEFSNLENGLNTRVGRNGSKLSGGQRQIVWCLRTILKNPDVLILDEPTASLDEKSRTLIKNLLDKMMKDKTVIIVTHDNRMLDIADKKIFIEKGVIKMDAYGQTRHLNML
jgi:ABC-type multidrug transport system fused ATPase/permease subunit